MVYKVTVLTEEHKEFTAFLNEQIRAYNNEHSHSHRASREAGAIQPLNIMVTDDEQQWLGGLTAEIYWDWMEIHKFWFQDTYRGQGLGGQLLAQAEEVAKQMGATKALLTTYEFQARTFYEAKGYQVVGEIKDYPPGSSYYTMVKVFT
ncbi:GNAT family N-acetyltransferase [Lysinibacillus piscis]|uniref:N-acetyltransferase n=1 Tax=Lysinibacillus piscis TaxID=2518931 RepID=A0ABQ5NKG7_9BACI|nr:GNAT family N-acetyltransferase [Lysinibacillus sp. KH24]GLC88854.1 N-acetyltransferase [Lysinibacillus sp. KH24]